MASETDTIIVGAGQAGLSVSHELAQAGIEHLVLERGRLGQSWRSRWDSFCLVLPNGVIRLAGQPYAGADPDGFMPRDEIVSYLQSYAESFAAPIREGTEVSRLAPESGGGFRLETGDGPIRAREVVVATGGYQRPYWPAPVSDLATRLPVIDSVDYRNPDGIPPGRVLVIGSGQTGCQIAEELRVAGREVVVACGKAPWQPRRVGGRDIITWMLGTPFMAMTLAQLPSPMARLNANPQASGRGGGHDLHYRTLQAIGVALAGHLAAVDERSVRFAPDLAESVAFGDARYRDIRAVVHGSAAAQGLPAPEMPDPPPFVADGPTSIDLADLACAIVTAGYRPDYARWIDVDGAFDDMGFPLQVDGSSSVMPGLHFIGVPFQRTRTSATLIGIGSDAAVLASRIIDSRGAN